MSAARDLSKLGNTDVFTVDTAAGRVGVDSTSPVGEFQVGAAITVGSASGIISATAFYGDGSNLEGVSSAGLGTALAEEGAGSVIYYTDSTLGIGSTVNVLVPNGSDVAYTQYSEIAPDENVDVIVADGDDFIVDVLGLSTAGGSGAPTPGGRIRAAKLTNSAADGAPQLTYGVEVPVGYGITGAGGINISGFATAGGFVGNLTGDVTGDVTGTASNATYTGNAGYSTSSGISSALTGTPDITVNNIIGVGATFTGVLTYEDVTNVDSVGIITARSGIEIGAAGVGGTITGAGSAEFVGIVTVTQGTDLNGYKVEEGSYDSDALNGEFDFELENGHIQTHTGSTAGTFFPDFRVSSTQSLASVMGVGDVISCTLIVAASNTAHYCTTGIKIDNSTSNVTIEWVGSAAPTAGKGAGYDIYGFTIQKTAATPAYLVIVNATDAG